MLLSSIYSGTLRLSDFWMNGWRNQRQFLRITIPIHQTLNYLQMFILINLKKVVLFLLNYLVCLKKIYNRRMSGK